MIDLVSSFILFLKNSKLENKHLELKSEDLSYSEKEFIRKNCYAMDLYIEIKLRLLKESKNSIKNSINEKFNCSKEDIDKISDYIRESKEKER